MGGTVQVSPPNGGGGGGGGGTDLSTTNALLQDILNLLKSEYDDGARDAFIDYLTIGVASTFQQLYANQLYVRRAVIQNISAVNITLTGIGSSYGLQGTNAQGIILNSGAAGQAGGSMTVGNIDLSTIDWEGAAGAKLAVYYER